MTRTRQLRMLALAAALACVPFAPAPLRAQMSGGKLTIEQAHTIKEILKDRNLPPGPSGTFEVGQPAPANATTQEFPNDVTSRVSAVKAHRFFVSGDQIVIVDPKDNTIADIIK